MHPSTRDISGEPFGLLMPLRAVNTGRGARWWCRCRCGNEVLATAKRLRSGRTWHCGCQRFVLKGKSLAGRHFGRWTAISPAGESHGHPLWWCVCTCGVRRRVSAYRLLSGHSTGCGHWVRESRGPASRTHGLTDTPEHCAWRAMKKRCLSLQDPTFENYGGRGITVCRRWLDSFESFLADVGPRPTPQHSLDRIDNDGPYSPENCRWATRAEQNRNSRQCHPITFRGETLILSEWARRVGITPRLLSFRLRCGWTVEKALTTPYRPRPATPGRKPRCPEYSTWASMLTRCHNPNDRTYKTYGARGIKVCDRWRQSFAAFLEDMGAKPSPAHSIDRLDNAKGYEPGNCRWATPREQTENRSCVRKFTLRGVTRTLSGWARRLGISTAALAWRVRAGWPLSRALTQRPASKRLR